MKKCAKIIDFLIPALVIFLMSATSAPANLAASRGAQPANPLITTHLSAPLASQSFKVGADPYGIAFDGTNIWVTNIGFDTVTKLVTVHQRA